MIVIVIAFIVLSLLIKFIFLAIICSPGRGQRRNPDSFTIAIMAMVENLKKDY
jgi:hypothetical protein